MVSSVVKAIDGGFIIVGESYSSIKKKRYGYVMKINAEGEKVWEKFYSGVEHCDLSFKAVRQTVDKSYIIAGFSHSLGKSYPHFLKVDKHGNKIWERVYLEEDRQTIHDVTPTLDGGYIAVGYSEFLNFELGTKESPNIYFLKLDEKGNKEWDRIYSFTDKYKSSLEFSLLSSVQTLDDGNYIAAGVYFSSVKKGNAIIIKFDRFGNIIWERTYGGKDNDGLCFVQPTNDGGYIAVGWTWSFGKGGSDMYILKLDENGNLR
ncbi:MAG: hypothetical protein ACTSR2_07520 [Candidatus Hodarchaeales archaeon]